MAGKIIRLQRNLHFARQEIETRKLLHVSPDLETPKVSPVCGVCAAKNKVELEFVRNFSPTEDPVQTFHQRNISLSFENLHQVDVVKEDFNQHPKCQVTRIMGQNSELLWQQY